MLKKKTFLARSIDFFSPPPAPPILQLPLNIEYIQYTYTYFMYVNIKVMGDFMVFGQLPIYLPGAIMTSPRKPTYLTYDLDFYNYYDM